jgi:LytR cell envelope-related transcriptional attenuator
VSPVDPSSPYRPARIAGLTLLGVAGAAFVLGLISLFDNGGGNPQSSAGASQSTAPGSSASAAPTSSGPPATITAPPPAVTSSAPNQPPPAPGSSAPPAAPPAGQGITAAPVRVLNNSTTKGLAQRAADDLRADGWNVADVGNYAQGVVPTTTVYYRPGTPEEEAAKQLAERIQARYEARPESLRNYPDGVIVMVTNDYKGPSADK